MSWIKRSQQTDTGARDITSLATGMTEGAWTIRRIGRWVHMNIYDARLTVASGTSWSSPAGFIPIGFRPAPAPPYVNFASAARVQGSGSTAFTTSGGRVSRYGGIDIYDAAGKRVAATVTWSTDDAWPTSLPGVSA